MKNETLDIPVQEVHSQDFLSVRRKEAADERFSNRVKAAGRKAGRYATIGAVTAVASVGVGKFIGNAIDRSPTVVYQEQLKANQAKEAAQAEQSMEEFAAEQVDNQNIAEQIQRELPEDINTHVK